MHLLLLMPPPGGASRRGRLVPDLGPTIGYSRPVNHRLQFAMVVEFTSRASYRVRQPHQADRAYEMVSDPGMTERSEETWPCGEVYL